VEEVEAPRAAVVSGYREAGIDAALRSRSYVCLFTSSRDPRLGGSSRDDGRSTANYACTMSPRDSISSGARRIGRGCARFL